MVIVGIASRYVVFGFWLHTGSGVDVNVSAQFNWTTAVRKNQNVFNMICSNVMMFLRVRSLLLTVSLQVDF